MKTGSSPPLRENSRMELGSPTGGLSRYLSRGSARVPVAPPSWIFRKPERHTLVNFAEKTHSAGLAASAMHSALSIILRATAELRCLSQIAPCFYSII